MKTTTAVFLFALLFFSNISFAQVDLGFIFNIGYNASVHSNFDDLSQETQELIQDFERGRISYSVGVLAGIPLSRRTNIRAGFAYGIQGFQNLYQYAFELNGEHHELKKVVADYHYIQLPIQIQQQLLGDNTKGLSVMMGCTPSYAYLFRSGLNQTIDGERINESEFEKIEPGTTTRNFLFPVQLGFQYKIPLGQKIVWEIGPVASYDFAGILKVSGNEYNRHFLNIQLTNYFCFF